MTRRLRLAIFLVLALALPAGAFPAGWICPDGTPCVPAARAAACPLEAAAVHGGESSSCGRPEPGVAPAPDSCCSGGAGQCRRGLADRPAAPRVLVSAQGQPVFPAALPAEPGLPDPAFRRVATLPLPDPGHCRPPLRRGAGPPRAPPHA